MDESSDIFKVSVRRFNRLVPWLGPKPLPKSEASKIARDEGVSVRQVYRWRAIVQLKPTAAALLDRQVKKFTCKRMHPDTEAVITQVLDEFYLGREEECSVPRLYDRIITRCDKIGAPRPSLNTIYRRVADLSLAAKAAAKKTSKKKDQFKPLTGRITSNIPFERIQIDHTLVDKILDLTPYGLGFRRPWLTLAIDIATRAIFGYYLSLAHPNVNSCALTMMIGFSDRSLLLTRLGISLEPFEAQGITEPWPSARRVSIAGFDNAREFISPRFTSGLEFLGIEPLPRPLGKKHYGGHIESLIGKFMADVHMLKGTTFSNVVKKGDYDSLKHAGMTFDEFEVWLVLNILRYHMKVHSALGCSPYTKFQLLQKEAGPQIGPTPSPGDARRAFLKRLPATIRKDGIQLHHRMYWSDRLAPYLGQRVEIAYHPLDLREIYVSLDGTCDHLVASLTPGQIECRNHELWDRTSPRRGRHIEDTRQEFLARQLLEAQDDLDKKTCKIGHTPLVPRHLPYLPGEGVNRPRPILVTDVQALAPRRSFRPALLEYPEGS
ncbi:MAG: hypothetical protein EP335_04470 [Alphaproteobacteria bacterium]|nr:MAG: hypothetical protein EP335_04470 [Alphaproteobacteria bacterium]